MLKKHYLVIGIIVLLGLFYIIFFLPTYSNPPDCNPPFFISKGEKFNQTIVDKESAHSILINLEPGWDHNTDMYQSYINSDPSDVEYKEIPVVADVDKKMNAFVLKNQMAIDSDGQIYRKGGCI
ncbi:MAG TPA: hypothetical protein VJB11_04130 [archaeon]|nr:hypothetical protein [archaeon]